MRRFAALARMGTLLCALAVGTLGAEPQAAEGNVASAGESVVRATLAGRTVEVGVRAIKVKRPDPGFPLALEGYDEVSIVRQIVVKVDGEEVWVPRSVYSDLFKCSEGLTSVGERELRSGLGRS